MKVQESEQQEHKIFTLPIKKKLTCHIAFNHQDSPPERDQFSQQAHTLAL